MEFELPIDFKELFELFNQHNVRYLLVGGYAVGLHGHVRATNDIDIVIAPDEISAEGSRLKDSKRFGEFLRIYV